MIVISKAPVRIDFAGGWTDVDIFAKGAGGAVVNATINQYVWGKLEIHDSLDDPHIVDREGMNVAYNSDLPSGSGLGMSSALNVVWLSLIKSDVSSIEDKKMIANLAYDLERMLGILGGKQDQYASAVGGINFMEFQDEVTVEPINVAPEVIQELQDRLVLCYTGRPRLSSNIHENVWGAYRRGEAKTINALYNLRNVAIRMKTVLETGDLNEFAELLNQNWRHQKDLDASVTNPQIDSLFDTAFEAGAVAGKACGAGGGGCAVFFCSPGTKQQVAQAIETAGSRFIEFAFEFEGLQVDRVE
ncbi:MAG: hypothetical protein Q7T82_17860 [Armatimonadota bacterium]|nr:hypothetical protein [Armatimonadota bacterium]